MGCWTGELLCNVFRSVADEFRPLDRSWENFLATEVPAPALTFAMADKPPSPAPTLASPSSQPEAELAPQALAAETHAG